MMSKTGFAIEIEIKTIENFVLILRLVLRFSDYSHDIETGIETFWITVLILRLVSRLSGLQS